MELLIGIEDTADFTNLGDLPAITGQISGRINLSLESLYGLADVLSPVCKMLVGNTQFAGDVYAFFDTSGGFGVLLNVAGRLGTSPVEAILGLFTSYQPLNNVEVSLSVSLKLVDDIIEVCIEVAREMQTVIDICFRLCDNSVECGDDSYCEPLFKVCTRKQGRAFPCLNVANGSFDPLPEVCRSGYCVSGLCAECEGLDKVGGCDEGEYCGLPNFDDVFTEPIDLVNGLDCREKINENSGCLTDVVCKSGYCVNLFCAECPTIDSSEGCGDGQFCAGPGYDCEDRRGPGGACLNANACESDYCVAGFCATCGGLDSTVGCSDGQFCGFANVLDVFQDPKKIAEGLRCRDKINENSGCLTDVVCKSGYCVNGFCAECPTIDSSEGCGGGQFCAGPGYDCEDRRGAGGACLSANACESGYCVAGFCARCGGLDSTVGCSGGQFCGFATCWT